MTEPLYQINEYVWDTVREGPAIIVGAADGVYTVAEIVEDRLGRVAHREETQLERYVKVILPEDEAVGLLKLLKRPVYPLKAAERLQTAIEKRGISWSQ